MKSSTLQKRLDKRYTGAKNSYRYKIIIDLINGTNDTGMVKREDNSILIRPCFVSGSGRYTQNNDHSAEIKIMLQKLGVKFKTGNDAPRGGKSGDFIKISTKLES